MLIWKSLPPSSLIHIFEKKIVINYEQFIWIVSYEKERLSQVPTADLNHPSIIGNWKEENYMGLLMVMGVLSGEEDN